ncbi:hypothetical protein DSCA_60140 [Desulfosarcina alkanivorans]|uniref:Uncharacterized protein n=1 Tax=Desulfosarcina alkanivorans TaxID=571177 RepID=A0A5K7Z0S0_9BACT|nr:hypothetical protein [Desulfosarcina alkanivorans]BBO72084.1 hypothetical protein DSCA_60140 [Desulfosarcina alkanivorans]
MTERLIDDIRTSLECVKDIDLILKDIRSFLDNMLEDDRTRLEWINATIMADSGLSYAVTHLEGVCTQTLQVVLEDLEKETETAA